MAKEVRHAHELEEAGEARWSARFKDGLLMVTDEASGEEVSANAYTIEGDVVRFSLPGENGLRALRLGEPGFDEFKKVLEGASKKQEAAAAQKSVVKAA